MAVPLSDKEKKVVSYIKDYEKKGYSDVQIRQALVKSGISSETIAKCMKLSGKVLWKKPAFLVGLGVLLAILIAFVVFFAQEECSTDRDCGRGYSCDAGACEKEELGEEVEEAFVEEEAEVGVSGGECVSYDDCGYGETCEDGYCVDFYCESDEECEVEFSTKYGCSFNVCVKQGVAESSGGAGGTGDSGSSGSSDDGSSGDSGTSSTTSTCIESDCGSYICESESACYSSCDSAGDSSECAAGYACNEGVCEALAETGDSCESTEDCSSGFCDENNECASCSQDEDCSETYACDIDSGNCYSCSDSDASEDDAYFVQGTVDLTYFDGSAFKTYATDSCDSDTEIWEYSCAREGGAAERLSDCAELYGEGYVCDAGACVPEDGLLGLGEFCDGDDATCASGICADSSETCGNCESYEDCNGFECDPITQTCYDSCVEGTFEGCYSDPLGSYFNVCCEEECVLDTDGDEIPDSGACAVEIDCKDGEDNDEDGTADYWGVCYDGETALDCTDAESPEDCYENYCDDAQKATYVEEDSDCVLPEIDCEDGEDNDGDGTADYWGVCYDGETALDCTDAESPEDCYENYCDDDQKATYVEEDSDCVLPEVECEDGEDNDGDGTADYWGVCYDGETPLDCSDAESAEDCYENYCDDDQKATYVEEDSDCVLPEVECEDGEDCEEAACVSTLPTCADGEDNDGDGDTDLEDSECGDWGDEELGEDEVELDCQDGEDNDGDGTADYWGVCYDGETPVDCSDAESPEDCYENYCDDAQKESYIAEDSDCVLSSEVSCTETGDDGYDLYATGTVTGTSYYDSEEIEWSDFCDNGQIVEYWCQEEGETYAGYAYGEYVDCPEDYSCSEGACVADEGEENPFSFGAGFFTDGSPDFSFLNPDTTIPEVSEEWLESFRAEELSLDSSQYFEPETSGWEDKYGIIIWETPDRDSLAVKSSRSYLESFEDASLGEILEESLLAEKKARFMVQVLAYGKVPLAANIAFMKETYSDSLRPVPVAEGLKSAGYTVNGVAIGLAYMDVSLIAIDGILLDMGYSKAEINEALELVTEAFVLSSSSQEKLAPGEEQGAWKRFWQFFTKGYSSLAETEKYKAPEEDQNALAYFQEYGN